jgi:sodium/potassium-transporting ATPase subunit beta
MHFFFTGKILLFYILFYSGLIGFFLAMIAVFYQTIDLRIPKWQQDKSVIGNNPGKISVTLLQER